VHRQTGGATHPTGFYQRPQRLTDSTGRKLQNKLNIAFTRNKAGWKVQLQKKLKADAQTEKSYVT